jgi:hypothetical protein
MVCANYAHTIYWNNNCYSYQPTICGFFNVMSIIDIVIGVVVVVPWNIYLIYKMKKESGKK